MAIHKYQRTMTAGPNGSTFTFRNSEAEPRATELAEVDGWHFVYIPLGSVLPEQHAQINLTEVLLDAALRTSIKAASRPCDLIAQAMQVQIRSAYTVEDEQYFSRIGVGVALKAYEFQAGEMDALLAFGAHVESVRQWGRDKRAEIGL